jgi:hypothetical protein
MIPWEEDLEKSIGKGLGQQTGGGATSDADEARKLLELIEDAGGYSLVLEVMGDKSANFVASQLEARDIRRSSYYVTGKQLFWLRDIKDRLVEGGHI